MLDFNKILDEDLYGMCKAGDDAAWEYVYNYILVICTWDKWNLHDDPRSIAQEITLHLINNALTKVKYIEKFRNFITVISVNKIKDSFKSYKHHLSMDEPIKNNNGDDYIPEYENPTPLPDEVILNYEVVSIIDGTLNKMASPCNGILREYFNYKLGLYKDYNELSKVLSMPIPTISSAVTRCLKKFIKFKEIKALYD